MRPSLRLVECALVIALGSLPGITASVTATAAPLAGCSSGHSGIDVNGDGYDDAVVGDPYATVAGHAGAGAVVVLYGDSDCRIGEGARRLITQGTAGVPGTPETGDHFGWSVAIDDLTGDGRADLLVGSPGEDVGSAADAGSVNVISFAQGSSSSAVSGVSLTQNDLGGVAETGDEFGFSVAAADSQGDEAGSLAAAGAPGEDLAGVVDAGVVDAFGFDGAWHLTAEFRQGGTSAPFLVAVPGTPEPGDRFGASLLIAQLNAPFTGDVLAGPEWTYVIGAPGDVVGGQDNAGSVTLAYTQTWAIEQVTQDSAGVPGVAESGDEFGSSLAVHETRAWVDEATRTAPRDLAVGAPGESVGRVQDAGSVTLFRSEVDGLHARAALTQQTTGVAGVAETGDRFGAAVAMRPGLDHGDVALVIGVPDEDVGSVSDAGLAQIVTVGPSAITPSGSYTENAAGTPGTVAKVNHFGATVAAMEGRSETLYAITSPYQRAGSVFLTDQAGSHRSWVPGHGGIPVPAGSGRFGWAVSGLESGA